MPSREPSSAQKIAVERLNGGLNGALDGLEGLDDGFEGENPGMTMSAAKKQVGLGPEGSPVELRDARPVEGSPVDLGDGDTGSVTWEDDKRDVQTPSPQQRASTNSRKYLERANFTGVWIGFPESLKFNETYLSSSGGSRKRPTRISNLLDDPQPGPQTLNMQDDDTQSEHSGSQSSMKL